MSTGWLELDTTSRNANSPLLVCRPSGSRLESGLLNAAVLAEQSIRVISVDRPGYGQSSPNSIMSIASFAGPPNGVITYDARLTRIRLCSSGTMCQGASHRLPGSL